MAQALFTLIGEGIDIVLSEARELMGNVLTDNEAEEERIKNIINADSSVSETEKEIIIKARKGQGKFRNEVIELHVKCPFPRVIPLLKPLLPYYFGRSPCILAHQCNHWPLSD